MLLYILFNNFTHEVDFDTTYNIYISIFSPTLYLLFFHKKFYPLSFNFYRSMETPNERSEFCVCIFSPCLIAFTRDSDSLESEGDEDR